MHEAKSTSPGQSTDNPITPGTTNADVQLTPFGLQRSVTVYVKLRFTAVPQLKAGKLGKSAKLSVASQPPVKLKLSFHSSYAVSISSCVEDESKSTAIGQLNTNSGEGSTLKVTVFSLEFLQSSVAVHLYVTAYPLQTSTVNGSTLGTTVAEPQLSLAVNVSCIGKASLQLISAIGAGSDNSGA